MYQCSLCGIITLSEVVVQKERQETVLDNGRINSQRRNMRRKRRLKRQLGLFLTMLAAALLCAVSFHSIIKNIGSAAPEYEASQSSIFYEQPINSAENKAPVKMTEGEALTLTDLYSKHAILINLDSGQVLAENGSREKIYPASLTKIMTAILAIEHTEDLSESVELPSDIFTELYAGNASMAGFQPGENAMLGDLLYGILLPSGAECCIAFADRIAGSEAAFADLMNQKAKELGMDQTHFTNSTGLHDDNHYTTVKDLSALLQYALKNDMFREVFTSSRYSTQPTQKHPDGFTFQSTMFKYMADTEVAGGEIIGGKTGYTDEAQLCLASLANINRTEYILVTANAAGSHNTEQFHILDAIDVYNRIGAAGTVS